VLESESVGPGDRVALLLHGATPDDVWLSGMPLLHIGGINGLLSRQP
jgi:hypothetical protein